MASPQIVVFFLYSETTGGPLTGATPTFETYLDTSGGAVGNPAISEVGGGAYKFTPVFPTDKGLLYIIDAGVGAGANPRFQSGFLRPEDFNIDVLTDLNDELMGKWQVHTTGGDANRLVLYRQDDTVLKKFDLKDASGVPTFTDPFSRIPV
jgi:hypothetical protein